MIGLLTMTTIAAGCGGTATLGGSPDAAVKEGDSGHEIDARASDARQPDGASCEVAASNYDQTCTKDSDCVLAPAGGDVCDACSAGSGDWSCDNLAAVNVSAREAYAAALAAALAPLAGTAAYEQCVIQSCTTGGVAACQAGTCIAKQVLPDAGGGDVGHGSITCGATTCDAATQYCEVIPGGCFAGDLGSHTCIATPSECVGSSACSCIINASTQPYSALSVLSDAGGCVIEYSIECS